MFAMKKENGKMVNFTEQSTKQRFVLEKRTETVLVRTKGMKEEDKGKSSGVRSARGVYERETGKSDDERVD
ncbi:hypothetical protein V6N11_078389 [Hibiscus sabdariffa]|uniref:Uncharacterized protein n=1 Tax=Hibiscus sabdariffa TaxID=183260 RepID=A0ABR2TFX0_9ROSI